ncbi:MAG: hypothetical protein AB2L22_03885 [Syntrophales bacterium]
MDNDRLLQLIQSGRSRIIEVQGDFTSRVMEKVREESLSIPVRILRYLLWNRGGIKQLVGIASQPKTNEECAVCYGLTGAFYGILGIVLLVGLKFLDADILVNHGMKMLPWMSFLAGAWLLGLAVIMMFEGQRAVIRAKAGTVLFIIAVMAAILPFVKSAWSPVGYLSVTLSLTAAFMGGLLYFQLKVFSKGSGGKNNHEIIA